MSPDSLEKRPPRVGISLAATLEKHLQERQRRLPLPVEGGAGAVTFARRGVRTTTVEKNHDDKLKFQRRATIVATTPASHVQVVSTIDAKMVAALPGNTDAPAKLPPTKEIAVDSTAMAFSKTPILMPPPPPMPPSVSPRSATDIEPQRKRGGSTNSKKTEQFQPAAGVSAKPIRGAEATPERERDTVGSSGKDDAHLLSWLNDTIYPPGVVRVTADSG